MKKIALKYRGIAIAARRAPVLTYQKRESCRVGGISPHSFIETLLKCGSRVAVSVNTLIR
jgi:hypothetical protein